MAGGEFPATTFTRAFGLRLPFVQAPMGGVAGPDLVAACADAGALGILPVWYLTPDQAGEAIRRTAALSGERFAVNLRADLAQHALISTALDLGVTVFHLFWGDPGPSLPAIRRAGASTIATVSDRDSAKAALDAGVDGLIAQGVEAGGHVFGTTPLTELLAQVVGLAGTTPVAAAGGVVEAEDVARVFAAGADAAVLGTCLIPSDESEAHPDYKAAVISAGSDQTVLSTCFDGLWPDAPHRTLRNSTYRAWAGAGFPPPGERPGEGEVLMRVPGALEVPRYHASTPTRTMRGDCEAMALYAGTGVGRVRRASSAASLIGELAEGSARLIRSQAASFSTHSG